MKRLLYRGRWILGVLVCAGVLIAAYSGVYPMDKRLVRVEPGQSHTLETPWVLVGEVTTGVTTPGVTARTSATFNVTDPNNLVYKIPSSWNGVRIRVASTTDGDSTVIDVFLMDSEDYDSISAVTSEFNRIRTQTWTTGTQTARESGDEWADTLAITNENWYDGKTDTLSPAGNYIAEDCIDVMGASFIGFSATTVTHSAKIYIKGL